MKYYPLKLTYATASMLWGGRRLIDFWGKKCDEDRLAETWELTVRDDGRMSFIENGEFAGISLRQYIEEQGNCVVSDTYDGGRFPLLIKFIDAADQLSVQVHPDDVYANSVENDLGKTEMWYIVEAEPDAKIIYGLANGVSREAFAESVQRGEYTSVMNYLNVKAGECYFIPSGMLHAIGAGILIAEIQQNSDLTYRVYDYDRRDKNGKTRELHVKKALDVVRSFSAEEIDGIRYENGSKDDPECLADNRCFKVIHVKSDDERNFVADKKSFNCLLCLGGRSELTLGETAVSIARGDCWFIPAGAGAYSIKGTADILIASV